MKRSIFAIVLVLSLILAGCAAGTASGQTAQIPAEQGTPTESTPPPADNSETTPAPTGITAERALEIALAHAGVARADARDIDVEPDRSGSTLVYDVDFEVGTTEYDYEIDAATGAILNSKVEPSATLSTAPAPTGITAERALEIALAHAGVARADARDIDVEPDREGGATVYEVDFESGAYEYEYEIDATTGAVILSQKESRD